MNEQLEFIRLIGARLESVGIPYMLTGSMAMAFYSMPRMTRDIDLIIEVGRADADKIYNLFSKDCYIDQDAVREAIDRHAMFNVIHNEWVIKADFIVRKNEEYRIEEFSRRQKVSVGDITIFVASAEDLILSKLIWGGSSQSDLQFNDVRQIISSLPKLDWPYLEKWAVILGIDTVLGKATENG